MLICDFLTEAEVVTFFFFNDTATTEIYTLSLHDALPICMLFNDRQYYCWVCKVVDSQLPFRNLHKRWQRELI